VKKILKKSQTKETISPVIKRVLPLNSLLIFIIVSYTLFLNTPINDSPYFHLIEPIKKSSAQLNTPKGNLFNNGMPETKVDPQ
jgi:hypothetical protein